MTGKPNTGMRAIYRAISNMTPKEARISREELEALKVLYEKASGMNDEDAFNYVTQEQALLIAQETGRIPGAVPYGSLAKQTVDIMGQRLDANDAMWFS